MVEKILNNTTPYGKIRASHGGLLHSSTLNARQMHLHGISFITGKLAIGSANILRYTYKPK